jgi:hypothetical protein
MSASLNEIRSLSASATPVTRRAPDCRETTCGPRQTRRKDRHHCSLLRPAAAAVLPTLLQFGRRHARNRRAKRGNRLLVGSSAALPPPPCARSGKHTTVFGHWRRGSTIVITIFIIVFVVASSLDILAVGGRFADTMNFKGGQQSVAQHRWQRHRWASVGACHRCFDRRQPSRERGRSRRSPSRPQCASGAVILRSQAVTALPKRLAMIHSTSAKLPCSQAKCIRVRPPFSGRKVFSTLAISSRLATSCAS